MNTGTFEFGIGSPDGEPVSLELLLLSLDEVAASRNDEEVFK